MPAKLTIQVEPDLKNLEVSFKRGIDKKFVRRRIALLASTIRTRIQTEAPKRTGKLRRSIAQRPLGELGQQIYVDLKSRGGQYEFFYRGGTKPHVIRPKRKRALWWPGASHPVRMVNHPGWKGDNYWSRAIDMSSPDIARAEQDLAQGIVKDLFDG